MFDWNDEELANIIWGEAGEIDDHIVPYPEGNEERPRGLYGDHIKKEWNQEAANAKHAEQDKHVTRNYFTVDKQESASQNDTAQGIAAAGHRMDPWPNLSLSHAAKTYQDSMGTEVSKSLTETIRLDSSRGDATSQLDDSSSIYENPHEDREQSDFVDYGWDNIGSFDDLDRIFSNDDQIFGHVSLGNADQPWSSSNEATTAPEKSFPLCVDSTNLGLGTLGNTSGHIKIKTEYVQDQDQSFTQDFGKMSYLSSHAPQNVHTSGRQVDFAGGKSKPLAKEKTELERLGKTLAFNSHLVTENTTTSNEFTDKVSNQKKRIATRKKLRGHEGQQFQGSCTTWSPRGNQLQQFGQIAPSMPQLPICNSFVTPSVLGKLSNQYSTMTSLPQVRSKPVLSGYEVSPSSTNPLGRLPDTSTKPQTMTPQEKIEKLRRRQQMQALLAIQKQQQQFSHQVSSNDHSVAHKCPHDDQIQLMQEGDIELEENVGTLLSIDPKSPLEHEDSNATSMVVDECYSVEDLSLHRLQDSIGKLDMRTRLCIRDSLFRLGQSAMQRHYAGDTSSANKNSRDEVLRNEEASSHNSSTQIPDVETDTNHIDRTVAHLLFYRPLESSGKHPETLESLALAKLPFEKNTTELLISLPENCREKQNPPYIISENPHLLAKGDQSKNVPCVETSDDALNEASDAGAMEIEASDQ